MIEQHRLAADCQSLPIHIDDARLDATRSFLILARRRHALLNHERRLTSSGAHT